MKMKSKNAGYKGHGRRGDRPSGPRQQGSGGGGGRPSRGGHGGQNGHGRRFGHNRGARGGPTACPMCGAVVTDLGAHMRSRHDDPASHPRD